jgi:hypothetical protein
MMKKDQIEEEQEDETGELNEGQPTMFSMCKTAL